MLNMKSIVFSFGLLILTQASWATQGDTSGGCGLGWKVNSSMSLPGTSTRGTTNSTFGGPFGTTSGTSGCERFSIVKNEMKAIHYVEANYDALKRESASGYGEALDGLASTLNCDAQAFGETMRAHFETLVHQESAAQFLREATILTQDKVMSNKCVTASQI